MIFLACAEYTYRNQLVDFYAPELKAFNNADVLQSESSRKTILCIGDSFTAGNYSYPSFLGALDNQYRIINAGIPGTGILQANYIAPKRFADFNPDIFIYQVYVGNDLFDIRYPGNWSSIPLSRSAYWWVANRLRVVGYINYRLGQMLMSATENSTPEFDPISQGLRSLVDPGNAKAPTEFFSTEKYSPRDRLYIQAEPALIENHVMLGAARMAEYRKFLDGLSKIRSYCKAPKCRPLVVFIPHASQTHVRYQNALRELGSIFTDSYNTEGDEYPFLTQAKKHLKESDLGHVKIINPLTDFRAFEANGTAVYYENDPHLNPTGQALLASLILKALKQK